MHVLITGASGYIGTRLVSHLLDVPGHDVTVITRQPEQFAGRGGLRAITWPVGAGWAAALRGVNAVVNLAGETIAQRWTPEVRQRIWSSRIDLTDRLVSGLRISGARPRVLVSASGTGFYGPRDPDKLITEAVDRGAGELAVIAEAWERSAARAERMGVRTAVLRIGPVVGPGAVALRPFAPWPFGLGRVGDGRQVLPWVHLDDVVRMILWALDDERARGPINCAAPNAVSQGDFARAIRRATGRPLGVPIPAAAARALLRGGAEALLFGQRAVPARAQRLGFRFAWERLDSAMDDVAPMSADEAAGGVPR